MLSGCNVRLSTDTFSGGLADVQHQTEVEPDSYSYGSTMVSTFQVGRNSLGGSLAIGWATSTDSGHHWSQGFLRGITPYDGGNGSSTATSNPSVAFDPKHRVWLIAALAVGDPYAIIVSRSLDGGLSWSAPRGIADGAGSQLDKPWIVCDDHPASPHFGNCYAHYAKLSAAGEQIAMSTSTDGGLNWTAANVPADVGFAGQPVVLPHGRVVVPAVDYIRTTTDQHFTFSRLLSYVSVDGGATYTGPTTISSLSRHFVGGYGTMRADPLPSAEIDANGRVYVAVAGCVPRTDACAKNDLFLTTTTDGTHWTAVTRVPVDAAASTVDHFNPGLGVDRATAGGGAHLALVYYYVPDANCTTETCKVSVGFTTSTNGGTAWSAAKTLGGPMSLAWLAQSQQGRGAFLGDFLSTSFSNGTAFPFFSLAGPRKDGAFDQAIYTTSGENAK